MEIVRRACSEVTTTSSSGSPLRPKQLSYCSPDVEMEANKQQADSGQLESAVRGRSTAVKNSTESPRLVPVWDGDYLQLTTMNSSTRVSRWAVQGQGLQHRVITVQLRQVHQLIGDPRIQVMTVVTTKMARTLDVVMVDAVNRLHRRLTAVDRQLVRSRGRNGWNRTSSTVQGPSRVFWHNSTFAARTTHGTTETKRRIWSVVWQAWPVSCCGTLDVLMNWLRRSWEKNCVEDLGLMISRKR